MKNQSAKFPELSLDEVYLNELISKGESDVLDFKYAVNDSRKIARSLVAFANAKGGRLLIGVKDNGVISGVRSGEELYMVDTANMMYCIPEVQLTKQKRIYQGKEVLEVVIEKYDSDKLCAVLEETGKEMVYVRMGSSNQLVNHIWLRVWSYKNSKDKVVKAEFRENEMLFLKLFSDGKEHTIEEIVKITNFSKKLCEHFLIKFAALDLIKISFNAKGVYYSQDMSFENGIFLNNFDDKKQ
jgi:predicted HTH transcriptional regulator